MSIKDYFVAKQREIDRKKRLDTAAKVGVGVVLGSLVGSAAGVLFAPKSGKETRKDLKDIAEKSVETVKAKTNELSDAVQETYSEALNKFNKFSEEKLTDLKKVASDVEEKAEEKAKEVKEETTKKANEAKSEVAKGVDKAAKKVEEGAKKVSDKAKEEKAEADKKK